MLRNDQKKSELTCDTSMKDDSQVVVVDETQQLSSCQFGLTHLIDGELSTGNFF